MRVRGAVGYEGGTDAGADSGADSDAEPTSTSVITGTSVNLLIVRFGVRSPVRCWYDSSTNELQLYYYRIAAALEASPDKGNGIIFLVTPIRK